MFANRRRNLVDLFRIYVVSSKDVRSPIMTIEKNTFFHIKHENIYLLAVTDSNPNGCLIFEFLNKICTIGTSYFGILDEESVKNNFTLIYDLFDGK
jgi:AP-2 complex subunit mu-1